MEGQTRPLIDELLDAAEFEPPLVRFSARRVARVDVEAGGVIGDYVRHYERRGKGPDVYVVMGQGYDAQSRPTRRVVILTAEGKLQATDIVTTTPNLFPEHLPREFLERTARVLRGVRGGEADGEPLYPPICGVLEQVADEIEAGIDVTLDDVSDAATLRRAAYILERRAR